MPSRLFKQLLPTRSIAEKLRRINLLTTGSAFLVAVLLLAAYDYLSATRELLAASEVKAQVLGHNSAAALLFDDAKAAGEVLKSLTADAQVQEAALWDPSGKLLASYHSAVRPAGEWVTPPPHAYALGLSVLELTQPVTADGRVVGTIGMRLDLGSLYQRLIWHALAFALVILIAQSLSQFFLVHLNRSITTPISNLAKAMARVSGKGDYAVRAAIESSDEIGDLAKGFNAMLEEIEARDRELATYRDELEQKVEQRTAELHHAKDLAEAGSRAKSEFLATMSHEIRTPMNGVLGMTELLRATPLNAQQQRFADSVYQSGEHLLSIINDILDFSKIEAGKIELETIHFNLRHLIEDIGALFAPTAEKKGIELTCSVPHDLPVAVRGDPVRLRQIVTNLVSNALKFTSQGEIGIRVKLLHEAPDEARLRFEVQDSGVGISEEAQQRLFSAFVQADSSTTRRFGGTGLGLVIARRLVEMMGGQIGLVSQVGKGTLFWLEIAFAKQDADARTIIDLAERLRGLSVLVVDDNATNRDILAHQLRGWSMSCTTAVSGHDALQRLAAMTSGGVDLAILDLHMPGMDGFEVAHAIRATERYANLPLVMLSSASVGAQDPERMAAEIDCYLTKPARQSDLYDAIATAMALKERARPRQRLSATASPMAPRLIAPTGLTPGGKVLVAEDNAVNQQVVSAMLESLGVACCLAENGRVAIERLAREAFDLVLMDCQMPEMDGFSATAEIRSRQRQGLLPAGVRIIALTANAVAGDRERCLAAGMDDYLSKPFTRDGLVAILSRWWRHAEAATPARPAAHRETEAATDQTINPRALAAIRDLPGANGATLVDKVIAAYRADAPVRLEQMRSALAAADAEALHKAAHGMKSSSANVGAERLAALCKELERLGRQATVDGARELLAAAETELTRALAALNSTGSSGATDPPG